MPSLKFYNDAAGKLAIGQAHFNNADASCFDSLFSATTGFLKVTQWKRFFQLGNVFDCYHRRYFIDSFLRFRFLIFFGDCFKSGENYLINKTILEVRQ